MPISIVSDISFTYSSLRSLLFKASHSVAIRILILLKILHKLTSEILVNSTIFITSISDKKYHKISLNFFSEICERIIYLFSIDKIILCLAMLR
nr:MAG TPA: hypothetical protein [Caudoviricetes sp.]